MIESKPTPSEIRARNRMKKQKPKYAPGKCSACGGTGEIVTLGQHASRCPACLGSGFTQQSQDRQVDAILFGSHPESANRKR